MRHCYPRLLLPVDLLLQLTPRRRRVWGEGGRDHAARLEVWVRTSVERSLDWRQVDSGGRRVNEARAIARRRVRQSALQVALGCVRTVTEADGVRHAQLAKRANRKRPRHERKQFLLVSVVVRVAGNLRRTTHACQQAVGGRRKSWRVNAARHMRAQTRDARASLRVKVGVVLVRDLARELAEVVVETAPYCGRFKWRKMDRD